MMDSNSRAELPTGAAVKATESDWTRQSGISDRPSAHAHGVLSLLMLVRNTVLVTFDALRGRYDG